MSLGPRGASPPTKERVSRVGSELLRTFQARLFATLEMRIKLDTKCARNFFRDRYWGPAGQLLAKFSLVPSNNPRSLCES